MKEAELLTAWATVEKKPLTILPASNASKSFAAAHHMADRRFATVNQEKTGSLPKYADRITAAMAPTPNMNAFPARE